MMSEIARRTTSTAHSYPERPKESLLPSSREAGVLQQRVPGTEVGDRAVRCPLTPEREVDVLEHGGSSAHEVPSRVTPTRPPSVGEATLAFEVCPVLRRVPVHSAVVLVEDLRTRNPQIASCEPVPGVVVRLVLWHHGGFDHTVELTQDRLPGRL